MILTVASPDKISINLFLSFIKFYLGPTWKDYVIGDMHSLMSQDSSEKYLKSLLEGQTAAIITYYARKAVNKDPTVILPPLLIDKSDVIFWFTLYATEYQVIKDTINFNEKISVRWKANIEKMNK